MQSDALKFELANATLFARLCSYVIIAWAGSLLLAIAIGMALTGHMPVYGVDSDPISTQSTLLNGLQVTHLLLSIPAFFAVPAWSLLIVHLLFVTKAAKRNNWLLWTLTGVSIGLYFLIRQTSAFLWLMD